MVRSDEGYCKDSSRSVCQLVFSPVSNGPIQHLDGYCRPRPFDESDSGHSSRRSGMMVRRLFTTLCKEAAMKMTVRQKFIVVCAYGLSLVSVPDMRAYEEIPIVDSGSLSGTVQLEGKVPMPKGYNLTTAPDPVYCGRISDGKGWRLLQPFDA